MADVKKTIQEAVNNVTRVRKAAQEQAERERIEREKQKQTPKS